MPGLDSFLSLFSLALDSISHRKLRSFLTMLGIFIGVASVVALIALGQGLSDSINGEFQKIGVDKLSVTPGGSAISSMYASSKLTDRDFAAVKRVNGVAKAGYVMTQSMQAQHGDKKTFAMVSGISTASDETGPVEEFMGMEIERGRDLNSNDRYKALIGARLATENIFGHELKLNDIVVINNTEFRVVGILKKVGDPLVDGALIIPGDAAKEVMGSTGYSRFVLKLSSGVVPGDLRDDVEKALRQSRGVTSKTQDFQVSTSEQLLESFNTIFGVVQAIIIGIAAISLLVGAVGIMNTMYTAVLERTKEIGIMKAVGAKNSEIMVLFLIESGLLGLVGGVIGVILGYVMGKAAEVIANQVLGTDLLKLYFPPELIIGALAFSFIIGALSGMVPARQASHLRPVDALRYE
ncbi:MAG: ABC transporter permease [Candidatus Micrarchaeia archaeon]